MFCRKCGNQLDNTDEFCPNCGFEVGTSNNANEAPQSNYNNEIQMQQKSSKALKTLLILTGIGVCLFLAIVIISLIGWGKVYLFNGYKITATLTMLSMWIMMFGGGMILTLLLTKAICKKFPLFDSSKMKTLTSLILICCIGFSTWIISENNKYDSKKTTSSNNSGGYYTTSYNSGISKQVGLSLKVDNIKTSGGYTYVYCTIKNVSSDKGVATRYRYVKVKAIFKDRSGNIVDTDWTYAVDSTWIEPGESKTFYFMVKNTNIKSATLSFTE